MPKIAKFKQMMDSEDLATLRRICEHEIQERDANFLPWWKEVTALTSPQANDWNDKPRSKKIETPKTVYDSKMAQASNTYANGMLGSAFSPAARFFVYSAEDVKYDKNDSVGKYLQQAAEIRYRQFNRSNFYAITRAAAKTCADLGTTCVVAETDIYSQRQIYTVLHNKRYVFLEDKFHQPDSLFYDFWLDAFEAADRFGYENLPLAIQQAIDNKTTGTFKFRSYIFPVDKFEFEKSDVPRMARGKPYAICTVAEDNDKEHTVFEGGYSRKRFFIWRYLPGSDGTKFGVDCPGLLSVCDAKQANALRRDFSRASNLSATPPIKATEQLRGRIRMAPGGITYVNPGEDYAAAQVTGNPQSLLLDIQALEANIAENYMNSLFNILSQNIDQQKTAAEVNALQGEKAVLMTAPFAMFVAEYLELVIEDGFLDDIEMGLLGPSPLEESKPLKIDMISQLAMLQKQANIIQPLNQYISQMVSLGQIDQRALDVINIDAYGQRLKEALGADDSVVRNTYEISQIRQAKAKLIAEQQAQQAQIEQANAQANTYDKMKGAPEAGSPMAQQMARQ